MKGLIIGVIIGAVAAWGWYQTDKGKISITEITTVTNTVVKTVEETRYVDQLRWVDRYQTNIVWVTNVVEKVAQIIPVVPVVQKAIEQPRATQRETPQSTILKKSTPAASTMQGPRPIEPVNKAGKYLKQRINKKMDGSVTTNFYYSDHQ